MPFVNGRYYMNPQYGAAMERARQEREGKTKRILGALADILDELKDSSEGFIWRIIWQALPTAKFWRRLCTGIPAGT